MKRALWLIVLYAGISVALFAQNADKQVDKKAGETKVYKIGDIGPAGGIIFYDKNSDSKADDKVADKTADWRYLEAAPAETEFTAIWGSYNFDVTGTGPTVGSGKLNTQLIVRQLESLGESNCAAQLCVKLKNSKFTDWFLPSKDELNLMYKNLHQKNMGKFTTKFSYWSSSQVNSECAWYQSFANGKQYNFGNYKYDMFTVRAIRAF